MAEISEPEWLSTDTAPKDGRCVVLLVRLTCECCPKGAMTQTVAWWVDGQWFAPIEHAHEVLAWAPVPQVNKSTHHSLSKPSGVN